MKTVLSTNQHQNLALFRRVILTADSRQQERLMTLTGDHNKTLCQTIHGVYPSSRASNPDNPPIGQTTK